LQFLSLFWRSGLFFRELSLSLSPFTWVATLLHYFLLSPFLFFSRVKLTPFCFVPESCGPHFPFFSLTFFVVFSSRFVAKFSLSFAVAFFLRAPLVPFPSLSWTGSHSPNKLSLHRVACTIIDDYCLFTGIIPFGGRLPCSLFLPHGSKTTSFYGPTLFPFLTSYSNPPMFFFAVTGSLLPRFFSSLPSCFRPCLAGPWLLFLCILPWSNKF